MPGYHKFGCVLHFLSIWLKLELLGSSFYSMLTFHFAETSMSFTKRTVLSVTCILLLYQGVQTQDYQNVPDGAASLAFVFDITGSMYDDLVQVIEGAAKILATTLSRREKPLYNYVLVPFHDPGMCLTVNSFTPDRQQSKNINTLYEHRYKSLQTEFLID